MKTYIISITSKDRPGIVAGASQAIYSLGGDLADVNQTVLYGYFTMILAASFSAEVTPEDIFAAISHQSDTADWEVAVKSIATDEILLDTPPGNDNYVITVRGHNRRGIVSHVADICAKHRINVLDLDTRLHDGVYLMAIQADVSDSNCTPSQLKSELAGYAEANDLTVTLQHNDIFRATNEIAL